jgi:two-component system, cell cycle sensor histidine kinase PleC
VAMFRRVRFAVRPAAKKTAAEAAAREEARIKALCLDGITHELRTPLGALVGLADMMSAQAFGPLGAERYVQISKDILAAGRCLLQHLDTLTELGRIEVSEAAAQCATVDAGEIVRRAVAAAEPSAKKRNVSLAIRGETADAWCIGSETGLAGTLARLIDRAVYAKAGRRIAVLLRREAGEVVVGLAEGPTVVASGPAAFRRDLDLDIAGRLAELMGGRISQPPGEDGVVLVHLPAAPRRRVSAPYRDNSATRG